MSILEDFRRDEERVLDRLVDGELGEAEHRELLAGLDDEPGAWRRCALAFLEAQTWRGELSTLAAEPLVASPARKSLKRSSIWGLCLAVAASLLVAFGLGMKYQSVGRLLQAGNSPRQSNDEPSQWAQDEWSEPEEDWSRPEAESVAESPAEVGQTITLALADGDEAEREIRLPVSNAAEGDQAWNESESTMPSELLQSLQQGGLEVRRQQRFMPIDLSDGRRLIVPIEEIEIHDPELAQYQ
jgi:hypothetical protein